jgi:uncharacterized protein (DUF58 family)
MPLRRRAWLTREGWYYLAVLAFIVGGAVLRSVNLLVVLAGLMIAPLLFNWRLVMASLSGLAASRKLPEQMLAGEPLTVEIEVENSRWWMSSWLLRVEDWVEEGSGFRVQGSGREEAGVRSQGPGARGRSSWWQSLRGRLQQLDPFHSRATLAATVIPHVPARARGIGTYRITLHRRGRYRFGPLRLSTRFPLGLVKAQLTLPEFGELIVAPRLGRLLPQWTALLEAEMVGDQRRHPQRGVSDGDYYSLRPWQSGDSLRWIHWRTTAKLGRPVVRQYERRRSRDVALVLDPFLPAVAREADQGLVELAISLAATAVHDIASRGQSRLTVALAGEVPEVHSGPASPLFCQEILTRLADLVPSRGHSLAESLTQALDAAPRGARLIVISPRAADAPSLAESTADLPLDPEDLAWIDTSSEQLPGLFVLE